MSNEELKTAMFNKCPVIHHSYDHRETEYDHVSAIIYRYIKGKLTVTAEVYDKSGRSVSVVKASELQCK